MVHILEPGFSITTQCILVLKPSERIITPNIQLLPGPVLSFICMLVTITLVINNLQILSGTDSEIITLIPWFILICVVATYLLSARWQVKDSI